MFGQEAVSERVDTMTAIMSQKLTCDDVVSMEFSYAPPVSTVIDPIAKAAESCLEQIDELNNKEEAEEVKEETENNNDAENVEENVESSNAADGEEAASESEDVSFTEYLRQQGLL